MFDSLPSIEAIGMFSAASLMVAISPGPTWMYVIATTSAKGRKQGAIAALGNVFGIGTHVVLAAAGISLIVASHGFLLEVLKYVGGGYLLYLGIKKLTQARVARSFETKAKDESTLRVFFSSMLINLLNPKVLLLFLAMMPQFSDRAKSFFVQSIIFGIIHILIATTVLLTLGAFIARAKNATAALASSGAWRRIELAGGLIICSFGVKMIFFTQIA